jgi:hypothetical protein
MSQGGVKAKTEVPTENRPPTYDHIRSMKKPVTRTLRLCLDSEIGEEYNEAQQALRFAEVEFEHAGPDNQDVVKQFKEAKSRFEKAEKAATERSVKFVFRSIGRKPYEELVLDWQPTDEQKAKVDSMGGDPDNMDWDPDEFPPRLVAAAMVEPEMNLEQVFEIYNDPNWSPAELGALFSTAQNAQFHVSVLDLGKG